MSLPNSWTLRNEQGQIRRSSRPADHYWLIEAPRTSGYGRIRPANLIILVDSRGTPHLEVDLQPDQPLPGDSWRRWEIDALVASYFAMLDAEIRGERPVKAEVNRALQELLPARTRGSIEYKLQNVSAVLDEEHLPFIDGYKPARNFQSDLREAVLAWVGRNRSVAKQIASYAEAVPRDVPRPTRMRDVLVERPSPGRRGPRGMSITQGSWGALRDDQLRKLGQAGERWVTDLERAELEAVGRADLARRVEWTSRDRGDGFGFDVSSFESDGQPIQIEVKTTNLGPRSPFYVTRNEVAKSDEFGDTYRLYRVFDFARDARLFVVSGSVRSGFEIEPMVYQARVN